MSKKKKKKNIQVLGQAETTNFVNEYMKKYPLIGRNDKYRLNIYKERIRKALETRLKESWGLPFSSDPTEYQMVKHYIDQMKPMEVLPELIPCPTAVYKPSRVQREILIKQEQIRIANNPILQDMYREAKWNGNIIALKRIIKLRVKSSIKFIQNVFDISANPC